MKPILLLLVSLAAALSADALDITDYVSSTHDQGNFPKELQTLEDQAEKDPALVKALREECRKKITFRRKNIRNVVKQMCNRLVKFGVWKEKPKRPSSIYVYKFQYINADRIEYYDYREGSSNFNLVKVEIKNCEKRIYEEEKVCVEALFKVYGELMSYDCPDDTAADSFTGQKEEFVGDNYECEAWIQSEVNKVAAEVQRRLRHKTRGTNGESSRIFY